MRIIGTSSAYPTDNNPTSSYLVSTDDGQILLDCGSGSMLALEEVTDLETIDHVFISHKHPDHIADLGVFQHRRLIKKMMNKELLDLQIVGRFDDALKDEMGSIKGSQVIDLSTVEQIGPFNVSFHQTVHPIPTYAIRLEINGKSIVYTADTAYCEDLIEFSKGADVLIVESSLYPEMDGSLAGHMTINEAIIFGEKSNAKQIILTHLPGYGPIERMHEEVRKSELANIIFAEPKMTITV